MNKRGFTLLEVMLATTILLGALVVLGELVSLGRRNAVQASEFSQAQMLCESKLAEIVLGLELPEKVDDVEFEPPNGWLYSIDVQPAEQVGFAVLMVKLRRDEPEEKRPTRTALYRLIPDPQARDSAAGDGPLGPAAGSSGSGGFNSPGF